MYLLFQVHMRQVDLRQDKKAHLDRVIGQPTRKLMELVMVVDTTQIVNQMLHITDLLVL
jgi:hypothetical protein